MFVVESSTVGQLVRETQQRGHSRIRAVGVKLADERHQELPGVDSRMGDPGLVNARPPAMHHDELSVSCSLGLGKSGSGEGEDAKCS